MNIAITDISKGNLSAAISELESGKALITKLDKLIRFADKNPAEWTAVEEYESDEFSRKTGIGQHPREEAYDIVCPS